jgi:ribose transport system permease protein
MGLLAAIFQTVMTATALGRHVLATGGNETAARFAGVRVGRVKAFVYVTGGVLAALSGVVLAVVQGQGKADLATGYELDIIAAAVVGGASLAGGRTSVVGAAIGALIFGVLRNALAQIPGGTFADRLILGIAVLVIVVMDRLATREGR